MSSSEWKEKISILVHDFQFMDQDDMEELERLVLLAKEIRDEKFRIAREKYSK